MELAVAIGLDTVSFLLTLLLVALGLIIIFGLMDVNNMAHGEFFLLGAYTVIAATQAGGSFWLAVLLAPFVLAIIGVAVEELVIRHVHHCFIDTILATFLGALLVRSVEGVLSENLGNYWLLILGLLFVLTVVVAPRGLFGVVLSLPLPRRLASRSVPSGAPLRIKS